MEYSEQDHLVTSECGHWTIRRLIAVEQRSEGIEHLTMCVCVCVCVHYPLPRPLTVPCFAAMVMESVPVNQLLKWSSSNRGCYVLCRLVGVVNLVNNRSLPVHFLFTQSCGVQE